MKSLHAPFFAVLTLLLAGAAFAAPATDCGVVNADAGLPGLAAGLDRPVAPPADDLAPVEGPDVSEKWCSASATCDDGSTITCTHSGSGSCQGVDASCPGEVGFVRCDRDYTYCPCPCNSGECSAQYYCVDINNGLHGSICPSTCKITTPCGDECGGCFEGPGGCICTE